MDFALIAGATSKVNMNRSGSPYTLALTSILSGEGVTLPGANAFQVESAGQYMAQLTASPGAITATTRVTFQIWNVTLGAVVGSVSLNANNEQVGLTTQSVPIPFTVVNPAHTFTLRAVVTSNLPNQVVLPLITTNNQVLELLVRAVGGGASASGVYGDGSDGTVVVAAPAAIAEDMYYDNLTINAGIALNAAGFRIFVRNTLTMAAGATITNNGGAGAAVGTAGAAAAGQTTGPGFIGAVGGAGVSVAGTAATTSAGGAGGASGASGVGGSGAGAAGGAAAVPTAAMGAGAADPLKLFRAQPLSNLGILAGIGVAGAQTRLSGGAGGASGAGDGAAQQGGGGGGGGGVLLVAARIFTGTGALNALGGAGGDGSIGGVPPADSGAGGGGGGGAIVTVSDAPALPATITTSAAGGAGGGNGGGTGGVGTAGAAGNVIHVQNGG